ncbi:MAG: hypothetical protein RBT41_01450 [Clostridia bacterium]|jgi:hypothetical protein|nr:hypothetical protein [Clostridia bacterium]
MWVAIITAFILILGIAIFLSLPFSPAKAGFQSITREKIKEAVQTTDVFKEADIAGLPFPLQRYFRYCGYLGTAKMAYMRAELTDVDFVMSDTQTIKIDYQQFNLVERPERFALISSSLAGIPFEGLDSFEKGKGSMQGKLAKIIPLFNQRGESMDRACLVTWLAECLMAPNAALQDFIEWEPIGDTSVKAKITWEGISAGGIFTFAPSGEALSFRTGDRVAVGMDGKETQADWSAVYSEYHAVKGLLQPKIIQSVWHYQTGDCIYFNQNEAPVEFHYSLQEGEERL